MRKVDIRLNRSLKETKTESNAFFNFINLIKDRLTPVCIILAFIYLVIEIIQATGMLPITARAFVGIFEIGLSIFSVTGMGIWELHYVYLQTLLHP